jgi:hypothetical protein
MRLGVHLLCTLHSTWTVKLGSTVQKTKAREAFWCALTVCDACQVDENNFQASLKEDALRKIELVIRRSSHIIARVGCWRAEHGGLEALRMDVLQSPDSTRGCAPNQAIPEVTPHSHSYCFLCALQRTELAPSTRHFLGTVVLKGTACMHCQRSQMSRS